MTYSITRNCRFFSDIPTVVQRNFNLNSTNSMSPFNIRLSSTAAPSLFTTATLWTLRYYLTSVAFYHWWS